METVRFVSAPQATRDTFAPALDGAAEATVARVMQGDELLGLMGPRERAEAGAERDDLR